MHTLLSLSAGSTLDAANAAGPCASHHRNSASFDFDAPYELRALEVGCAARSMHLAGHAGRAGVRVVVPACHLCLEANRWPGRSAARAQPLRACTHTRAPTPPDPRHTLRTHTFLFGRQVALATVTNLMDREVFKLEAQGYPVIGGRPPRGLLTTHSDAVAAGVGLAPRAGSLPACVQKGKGALNSGPNPSSAAVPGLSALLAAAVRAHLGLLRRSRLEAHAAVMLGCCLAARSPPQTGWPAT